MQLRTVLILIIALVGLTIANEDVAAVSPSAGSAALPVKQTTSLIPTDAITIPGMLSYQGRLTDTLGRPVEDGNYQMTFRLYQQETGGSPFWTENQTVRVKSGLFSVLLGAVRPITSVPENGEVWLSLQLGTEPELAPRLRIVSSAYSFLSEKAQTLDQNGAGVGQVLKWNGTAWAAANDEVGGDNAWVRGTPDSVLYTVRQLGIARGGANNMLYGSYRYTHTNLGVACTTGTNGENYYFCTVGGGEYNAASGNNATVGGGGANTASGSHATVAGGGGNRALGDFATVAGGFANGARGWSTVCGGGDNAATGTYAVIGGGWFNTASGTYAVIGGGGYNAATGTYAVVGNGYSDTAKAIYGGVFSGYSNLAGDAAGDTGAVVCGGKDNSATAKFAFIGGGFNNRAESIYATVGGGRNNTASGAYATVAGGDENTASGYLAMVGGGYRNTASDASATVGGGEYNTASDIGATVAGGGGNTASGGYATVAGGYTNTASGENATVGGGLFNTASGNYAAVAGGYCDTAAANYSFAVGNQSIVPLGYLNSAAFNGQTATASTQLRCGTLSKAGGTFTIDHPVDPYNKILNHYFVEGPEMRNLYDGEVILDASGRATVHLPDYFSTLNRKPRIQLTGVGTSDVYVAEDIKGNTFVIGGKPGTKVYWQVTGERQDVSAEAIRRMMPVEQPKTGALAGRMLDDEFLAGCMEQLEREGKAQGINFRTAEGRRRYEQMKNPPKPEKPQER
jgi:hypothetical protein